MLTRREGERLLLLDGEKEIVVLIREIRKGQVSVGIQAPPSVKVLRAELHADGDKRGAYDRR
jgi:carbon storage regulator CsrA